jgi:hypothetical protein
MFKRLLLFLLFFTTFSSALPAQVDECQDHLQNEIRTFLSDGGQELIPKLYSLVLLKLLREIRFSDHRSIEEWLQNEEFIFESSDEMILERLRELYQRYQINTDLNQLAEEIQISSPWSPSLRLREEQISQYIMAQSILNPEGPWSELDAATVWLVSNLLEMAAPIAPRGSAEFNQIALSTSIVRITQSTPASGFEVNEWIHQNQSSIQNDLSQLIQSFLNHHRDQCGQWFSTHFCFNGQLEIDAILPSTFLQLQSDSDQIQLALSGSRLRIQYPDGMSLTLAPTSPELAPNHQALRPESPEHILSNLPAGINLSPSEIQVQALRHLEEDFNALSNEEEKLHLFHRDLNQLDQDSIYGVIDRVKKTISFYIAGTRVQQFNLDLSNENLNDQHRSGGAGLYRYAYSSNSSSQFYLTDQRDRNTGYRLAANQNTEQLNQYLSEAQIIYILPVEAENRFRLRQGQLQFTHDRRHLNPSSYNFSPRNIIYRELQTLITDQRLNTLFNRDFLAALDREKATLMRLYDLDNDDYNELVRMSFGILGNESDFSTSSRYWIKESLPWLVSLMKGEGFDTSSNSRGPTQIKAVPQIIAQHYGVTKSTLHLADHAAVATLGFLAQSLQELRNRERHHPDITPYNRLDYLHYIYMGRASEITRGTATPERNIYYRQMREIADSLVQREIVPTP